jgi:hypothetical protein
VPVDHEAVARDTPQCARREQREVWKRRRVDDVVASPTPQQAPKHAEAEHQRRQDPAAGADIQTHSRPDGDDAYAGHAGIVASVPLAQRQIGHVVAGRRESLREIAVPTLGTADGVREQAVIYETDAHRRPQVRTRCRSPRLAPAREQLAEVHLGATSGQIPRAQRPTIAAVRRDGRRERRASFPGSCRRYPSKTAAEGEHARRRAPASALMRGANARQRDGPQDTDAGMMAAETGSHAGLTAAAVRARPGCPPSGECRETQETQTRSIGVRRWGRRA